MAAVISVVSSGSGEPGLGAVADAFREATGLEVDVTYDDRVADNHEGFDVLLASTDAIERVFRPADEIEDGGITVGSMALGLAVRTGAPSPDISDLDAFKRTVLALDTLVLASHSSGIYVETMLKKIGIHDQVAEKIEWCPNGPRTMDRLVSGSGVELCCLSINQLKRYEDRGLVIVGPLPDEIQYVRQFILVPMKPCRDIAVARQFVEFAAGPGKPILQSYGFI